MMWRVRLSNPVPKAVSLPLRGIATAVQNQLDQRASVLECASACIFFFVLLGSGESRWQAGVICPPAGGQMTVWRGNVPVQHTLQCVMRARARSTPAHCPKLEPLLERTDRRSAQLVSIQV